MLKRSVTKSTKKVAPATKVETVKKSVSAVDELAIRMEEDAKAKKAAKATKAAAKDTAKSVVTATQTIIVKSTTVDGQGKFVGEQKDVTDIQIIPFVTDTAKVSIGSKLKRSDGDYGSSEISVMVTVPCYVEEIDAVYEQTSKLVNALITKEAEEAGLRRDSVEDKADDTDTIVADSDEEEATDEDDALTEEAINAMKKKELVALIKANDLDVEVAGKSLAELRKEIIEFLSEEEEESDEEEESEEEEADDEDAEEEEDSDDSDDEDEEESDEEESDDEEDDDVEEDAPYTKKELQGASLKELKTVIDDMKIKVKVKADASPSEKKEAYVKAILKAQE